MGHHTFDAGEAAKLEDAAARYRSVSREELLWGLDLTGTETVVDLGSGTGFYTDDVASHADRVYAVDVQEAMHDHYREKGVPANGEVDAAVSTMTYHEFTTASALAELARVLPSGGRLVVADWSADGSGENGPPLSERFGADEAATALEDAGFDVEFRATRPETFLVVATNR